MSDEKLYSINIHVIGRRAVGLHLFNIMSSYIENDTYKIWDYLIYIIQCMQLLINEKSANRFELYV